MLPIVPLRMRASAGGGGGSGLLSPFYPTTLYSMRKRNSVYAGACCRVKNLVTTTETDIGFDTDGWCDATALLAAWTSGQPLRMTKWYDQSGGGVDAVQTSDSVMPLMVDGSGNVSVMDGKPCGKWDDANRYLEVATNAAFGLGSSPSTIEAFVNSVGWDNGHLNVIIDLRTASGADFQLNYIDSVFKIGFYDGTSFGVSGSTVSNATTYHLAWSYDGTNLEQYIDGVRQKIDAIAMAVGSTRPLWIGNARELNGSHMPGFIGEIAFTKGAGEFTGSSFAARTYS